MFAASDKFETSVVDVNMSLTFALKLNAIAKHFNAISLDDYVLYEIIKLSQLKHMWVHGLVMIIEF